MIESCKAEFDKFRGWFTLIHVDTELYEKIGKYYHQKGISIDKIDKIVFLKTGRHLILGKTPPAFNLMVETGRELHASLMVNDVSHYSGNLYPTYIHIGDGTTPPTIDDWKLESPWVGGAYAITVAERDVASHCKWEATIASGDSGTLGEAGLFLQEDPPEFNPQNDPLQYPYSMLHRALFVPSVVKTAGQTEVVVYEAIF